MAQATENSGAKSNTAAGRLLLSAVDSVKRDNARLTSVNQ